VVTSSWIGVQGADKVAVLRQLGFAETDKVDSVYGARFSCAELAGGWIILHANDLTWASPKRIASVSNAGYAVGCQMSTVIMFSGAQGYLGGERRWSVVHYRDENRELEVAGDPPAVFGPIRDRLTREQEEDDGADFIFEVPLELMAAVCGFRPDADVPGPKPVFKALAPVDGRYPRGVWAYLRRLMNGRSSSREDEM